MDTLTFIEKILEHVAWPTAAVAIVIILRKEIQAFLPSIKSFTAGPVKVELERVAKELAETKEVAASANAKAQVVAAKFDEADTDEAPIQGQPLKYSTTPVELKVLKAMTASRFATRSITGVAKDTGLNKADVQLAYGKLIEKGFIEQTTNDEGKLRWYPTALGRIAASEP